MQRVNMWTNRVVFVIMSNSTKRRCTYAKVSNKHKSVVFVGLGSNVNVISEEVLAPHWLHHCVCVSPVHCAMFVCFWPDNNCHNNNT